MKEKLARAKTRIPPARGCQRRVGVCPCVPSLRERASCRDSSCARALTRTGASTASHAGKFACTRASFACIRRCSCRLSSVTCNLSRPLYHVTPSPRPLFYLTPSPRDCLPLSVPLPPSAPLPFSLPLSTILAAPPPLPAPLSLLLRIPPICPARPLPSPRVPSFHPFNTATPPRRVCVSHKGRAGRVGAAHAATAGGRSARGNASLHHSLRQVLPPSPRPFFLSSFHSPS